MAPGTLLDENSLQSTEASRYKSDEAPRFIFPDGIRTSGQHPPLYDVLPSYSEFPKKITGSTVWERETFVNNPERWTHRLTEDEIADLGAAADRFISSGTPLTGISKVSSVQNIHCCSCH